MLDHSESFVASAAQALNSDHIPCVLWGDYLLDVHGVPSIISVCTWLDLKKYYNPKLMSCKSIDFVIPDDRLCFGAKALTRLQGLTPCPNQEVCPASSQDRYTPPPAFHMHTIKDEEVTVGLYPQSDTLWFLPPLDSALSSPEQVKLPSQFVLASDQTILPPCRPGRGSGVFNSGLYPVIVPKSHILREAYLRLHARDVGKRKGAFSMSMVGYMELYVNSDGLLDVNQLPEPLRGTLARKEACSSVDDGVKGGSWDSERFR